MMRLYLHNYPKLVRTVIQAQRFSEADIEKGLPCFDFGPAGLHPKSLLTRRYGRSLMDEKSVTYTSMP